MGRSMMTTAANGVVVTLGRAERGRDGDTGPIGNSPQTRDKRPSSLAYDRRRELGQVRRREAKPEPDIAAIVAPPRIDADVRACFGAIEVRRRVLRESLLGDL